MKKLISIIVIISLVIIFNGCNRDNGVNPNDPNVNSLTGAYILSEGSFSPGTSKLSYYDIMKDSLYLNIFHPVNIGLFPDGLVQNNSNYFITEQGNFNSPGKIYKIDSTGYVLNSLPIGTNPYSLCIANGKAYITNGPASNVVVLDINNFIIVKTISVGVYPQEIMAYNNKVYVCNTSMYGGASDSTISVIDALNDVIISTIKLQKDPSSLAFSNDNMILTGCYGANGKVYKINPATNSIIDTYNINDGFNRDISVDKNSNDIYFISNSNNIEKLNLQTRIYSVAILNLTPMTTTFNGYAFNSYKKNHYILDAKNFTTSGELLIYDYSGNKIGNFTTGIAPRRILIKNN